MGLLRRLTEFTDVRASDECPALADDQHCCRRIVLSGPDCIEDSGPHRVRQRIDGGLLTVMTPIESTSL